MHDENTTKTAASAVAYLRINHAAVGPAADAQTERQARRCREVATQHGLTIIREYMDTTGAVRIERRPELTRLLEELPATGATYVIAPDLGRLSREAHDVITIEQRLTEVGAELLVWGESPIHAHLRRRMVGLIAEGGTGREGRRV